MVLRVYPYTMQLKDDIWRELKRANEPLTTQEILRRIGSDGDFGSDTMKARKILENFSQVEKIENNPGEDKWHISY